MSYNGSGTFNINTSGQPVVTGTVISSTAFNALTSDLGTGLSTAITKDGQTVATARIPFAQGINSSLVTDATSTTTGSIITAGGVGIAKALFVGTTANITGTTTLAGVTATSITDSGLTSGRVTYAGTAGLLQDSANLTFSGSALAVTGTLSASDGTNGNIKSYVDVTAAYLQSLNQAANAYRPLLLMGSTVSFANNGNTNATLDSSGNLGIGETTPIRKLQVKNAANAFIARFNGGASSDVNIGIYANTATAFGSIGTESNHQFKIFTNGTDAATFDTSGNLLVGGTSNALGSRVLAENASGNQVAIRYTGIATYYLNATSGGDLAISKDGTVRATIDSSGNLLVGKTAVNTTTGVVVYSDGAIKAISDSTAPINTVQNCFTNSNSSNSNLMELSCGQYTKVGLFLINTGCNAGNTANHITFQYGAGTNAGYITSVGSTTSYSSASDYRLKTDVIPMANSLAKNAQLKPVTFSWIDGAIGEGFIAHELQEIFPHAVVGEKDQVNDDGSIKPQAVDTSFLVAHLVSCIQELESRLAALENK